MALTKISTGGVKDDAASQAKIADEAIDEARLQVSNAGSNGQFLSKQSGATGGLTWAAANEYTHPNHSGEVTSTADGAQVITDDVVDEANLKISNAGSNGDFLQKQSGNTGGLTWATPSSGAWAKLTSGTFSSSDGSGADVYKTITTTHLTSTYKFYKLSMLFSMSSTSWDTGLQVYSGGAWKEADYKYELHGCKNGGHDDSTRSGQNRIHFGDDNWYSKVYQVEIFFGDVDTSNGRRYFKLSGLSNNSTNGYSNQSVWNMFASWDNTAAVTGVRVKASQSGGSSGNFDHRWYVLEGCAI
jgi:hypothetical protein